MPRGIDEHLSDLIRRLLEPRPEKRPSPEAILSHPWLQLRRLDSPPPPMLGNAKLLPRLADYRAELKAILEVLLF